MKGEESAEAKIKSFDEVRISCHLAEGPFSSSLTSG